MRTSVALLLRIGVLAGLAASLARPAGAQINDAAAALDSMIRQAQRAITGKPKASRIRQRRRSSIATDNIKITPPAPLPVANPGRLKQAAAQQETSQPKDTGQPGPGKAAKTAGPGSDPTATTTTVAPPPPPPDVWTSHQIEQAMLACRKVLKGVDADVLPTPPIKRGPCGDAAPVKLAQLGGHAPVMFAPPATLNCQMVRALDTWLRRGLQPLAVKHLGSRIVEVSVMSSYSCRNSYGRKGRRLSEHGRANALDIGGFVTANGDRTTLLAHWGPTERDIVAAARKAQIARQAAARRRNKTAPSTSTAQTPAQSAKPTPQRATPTAGNDSSGPPAAAAPAARVIVAAPGLPPTPQRRPSLRQRWEWSRATTAVRSNRQPKARRDAYRNRLDSFLSLRNDLGGPKQAASAKAAPRSRPPEVDRAAFLKGAHRTACRIFGTVLGPEANDAHRDHFHVDLATRRRSNYCR